MQVAERQESRTIAVTFIITADAIVVTVGVRVAFVTLNRDPVL